MENGNEMKVIMADLNQKWEEINGTFDQEVERHNGAIEALQQARAAGDPERLAKQEKEYEVANQRLIEAQKKFYEAADGLCAAYQDAVEKYGEPVRDENDPVKVDFLTMVGLNLHICDEMIEYTLKGFIV